MTWNEVPGNYSGSTRQVALVSPYIIIADISAFENFKGVFWPTLAKNESKSPICLERTSPKQPGSSPNGGGIMQ